MIPLLRVMQRVSLYYYTIITYYHVIITPGSIITHCYLFQSHVLADVPPDRGSLPPRRAAGPGAHNVGQGLTVTAAPTPGPWLPPSLPVHRGRAPSVSAKGQL